MDCQSFAGSLGRYYVGNWYVALQFETVTEPSWIRETTGIGNQRNPQTSISHEQYYILHMTFSVIYIQKVTPTSILIL